MQGAPLSRLAAALALSLTAHFLVAWALAGLPTGLAGGKGEALQVRIPAPIAEAAAAAPAAGPVRLAAAPRYWPAGELDVRPQIMTHVMPEYPADLPTGVRGRIVLELFISSSGTLDRIRIVRALPPGRFEQSVLKAFSGARFTPGKRKGKAVPSVVRIEVTFGD